MKIILILDRAETEDFETWEEIEQSEVWEMVSHFAQYAAQRVDLRDSNGVLRASGFPRACSEDEETGRVPWVRLGAA